MRVRQWTAGLSAAVLVASGAALAVADRASATGGDQVSSSADGHVAAAAPTARVAADATVIRFDELPAGTTVTDQYAVRGIVFAGADGFADPFISPDGASPTSPVLSGSPRFTGSIAGSFVRPGTDQPATVDRFSLDVGYIDTPGSVAVTVYAAGGATLGTLVVADSGINRLTSTFPGAARFVAASTGDEPAGFGIDNLSFTVTRKLAALGDSLSSGEGAGAYDAASGGCHRTARAWPRLLGADEDAPVDLVAHLACSGATTVSLVRASGGEGPQLQQLAALDPAPDLVTITIGANDLGLNDVLTDCYLNDCVTDRRTDTARTVLARNLGPALIRAFQQVRATVPDADVVVVGYPRLLPSTPAETAGCPWLKPTEQTRFKRPDHRAGPGRAGLGDRGRGGVRPGAAGARRARAVHRGALGPTRWASSAGRSADTCCCPASRRSRPTCGRPSTPADPLRRPGPPPGPGRRPPSGVVTARHHRRGAQPVAVDTRSGRARQTPRAGARPARPRILPAGTDRDALASVAGWAASRPGRRWPSAARRPCWSRRSACGRR